MINISNEIYESLKSWPFLEAKKIIEKFGGIKSFNKPDKNYILFEKY